MATKLHDLRNSREVTLVELTRVSAVAESTVNTLDSGKRDISRASFDTVYRLAKALGVRPEALVEDLPKVKKAQKRVRALPEKFK
ncbi:hypothetical protein B9G54_06450 [Alloscardovia macacae]|uniref:HTH cro/C1-type domain-containing protein n=1 Tax=Alloscardovia macacae TaxID=1160091 RepID=A0A1Y2T099_9BIFI|nr:helix-turn-helix domain-containing protein [Alloscardovia macacae]OTA25899.1 hypothetical protein B9G54_06450 [Alloscardovia macacae]OTA28282.1 hypothetical protein B9T39_07115 [Alloscardovia macacae]